MDLVPSRWGVMAVGGSIRVVLNDLKGFILLSLFTTGVPGGFLSKLRAQHALVDGTYIPMLNYEGISLSENPNESAFRLVIVSSSANRQACLGNQDLLNPLNAPGASPAQLSLRNHCC